MDTHTLPYLMYNVLVSIPKPTRHVTRPNASRDAPNASRDAQACHILKGLLVFHFWSLAFPLFHYFRLFFCSTNLFKFHIVQKNAFSISWCLYFKAFNWSADLLRVFGSLCVINFTTRLIHNHLRFYWMFNVLVSVPGSVSCNEPNMSRDAQAHHILSGLLVRCLSVRNALTAAVRIPPINYPFLLYS